MSQLELFMFVPGTLHRFTFGLSVEIAAVSQSSRFPQWRACGFQHSHGLASLGSKRCSSRVWKETLTDDLFYYSVAVSVQNGDSFDGTAAKHTAGHTHAGTRERRHQAAVEILAGNA